MTKEEFLNKKKFKKKLLYNFQTARGDHVP
jgi:hypothetical protein